MDDLDHLQGSTEVIEQQQIAAARGSFTLHNPSKCCLFCGRPTGVNRRWCDADCRDDWEREQ